MKVQTKKRLGALVLAGLLATGGFLAAAPAYAGGNGSAFAGPFHASASTSTWGGTQGRSYAQHGCASFNSGWSTGSSSAWASCGISTGVGKYYFR